MLNPQRLRPAIAQPCVTADHWRRIKEFMNGFHLQPGHRISLPQNHPVPARHGFLPLACVFQAQSGIPTRQFQSMMFGAVLACLVERHFQVGICIDGW